MLTLPLVLVPANYNAKSVLAPLAELNIGVTTFQEGVNNVVSGSECGACVVGEEKGVIVRVKSRYHKGLKGIDPLE